MTSKQDWIKQAAQQYKKNGAFSEGDDIITDSDATEWAEEELEEEPDLINKDPVEYAKSQDISNWFKE